MSVGGGFGDGLAQTHRKTDFVSRGSGTRVRPGCADRVARAGAILPGSERGRLGMAEALGTNDSAVGASGRDALPQWQLGAAKRRARHSAALRRNDSEDAPGGYRVSRVKRIAAGDPGNGEGPHRVRVG